MKTKTPFVAEKSEVREIELNENYLKKLGFLKEEINTRIRFRKNSIIISKAFIKVHDHNSYVYSEAYLGFSIGDLTDENINMKQYIEDDKFNFEKFHLDYPRVTCINELFDYLKV